MLVRMMVKVTEKWTHERQAGSTVQKICKSWSYFINGWKLYADSSCVIDSETFGYLLTLEDMVLELLHLVGFR